MMGLRTLLACLWALSLGCHAYGEVTVLLPDARDNREVVRQLITHEEVRIAKERLRAIRKAVYTLKQGDLEKLVGDPVNKVDWRGFAMPVGQARMFTMSGIRYADESKNKDHIELYLIKDRIGLKVWYGLDGESPRMVVIYLKVDEAFQPVTKENLQQRLAWEDQRLTELEKLLGMNDNDRKGPQRRK